jgi:uncharacterized protein YkwD
LSRFARRATIVAAFLAAPVFAGTLAGPALAGPALAADGGAARHRTPVVNPGRKHPVVNPVKTTAVTAGSVAYETEVVTLTNRQRTAAGCGALRIDSRLVAAARKHSADMIKANLFSHTGSDGSNFVAREIAAGYPKNGPSAENIAYGYRTPQAVVTGWMNSAGHRENILNCGSVAVGVGLVVKANGTAYWTQDFGRR